MSGLLKKLAARIAAVFLFLTDVLESIVRDVKVAFQIVPGCWTLYLIMLVLGIGNLFVFLNGFFQNDFIARLWKYALMSLLIFSFVLFVVKTFEKIMNGSKATTEDIARMYIFYWTLSRISLLIDSLMIGMIGRFGIWYELLLVIPLFFAICLWNIRIYDKFLEKGIDLFKEEAIKTGKMSRFAMKNRKTIFWLGSIILEPDIVTIFLREKTSVKKNLLITFLSTVVCISVWSVVFWLGLQGFELLTLW
jgi:hypothetical protein